MNWIEFEQKLNSNGLNIFTPLDIMRLTGKSEVAVRFSLHRYAKKGVLIRLKKGLYALRAKIPGEFEIANRLYIPSYVSLEYALSFYKLIPETLYTVTSITTKATREFTVSNIAYQYNKIKNELFFGYEPVRKDNVTVLIATPEKAFLDFMYFVSLKKKPMNERINIKLLDRHKVFSYAEKFKRDGVIKLIRGLL